MLFENNLPTGLGGQERHFHNLQEQPLFNTILCIFFYIPAILLGAEGDTETQTVRSLNSRTSCAEAKNKHMWESPKESKDIQDSPVGRSQWAEQSLFSCVITPLWKGLI